MGYELPTQPARPLRSSDVEQTRGPQGSHDGIDNPAFPLTCVGMRGQQGPESRSHGYRVLNVGVGNKRIFQWWNIHGHPFTSVIMTIVYIMTRSEEHTSELQSLMRISYAVFCLNKKNQNRYHK